MAWDDASTNKRYVRLYCAFRSVECSHPGDPGDKHFPGWLVYHHRCIIWWIPGACRHVFYDGYDPASKQMEWNGRIYSQLPAFYFIVDGAFSAQRNCRARR